MLTEKEKLVCRLLVKGYNEKTIKKILKVYA